MKRLASAFGAWVIAFWIIGAFCPSRSDGSLIALNYRKAVGVTISEWESRPPAMVRADFWSLVRNNTRVATWIILLGTVTAGVWGAEVLAVNGLRAGELFSLARAGGVPVGFYFLHLLPHAIPEYAGYIAAETAAVAVFLCLFEYVKGGPLRFPIRVRAVAVGSFLLILGAAYVESYVSPYL